MWRRPPRALGRQRASDPHRSTQDCIRRRTEVNSKPLPEVSPTRRRLNFKSPAPQQFRGLQDGHLVLDRGMAAHRQDHWQTCDREVLAGEGNGISSNGEGLIGNEIGVMSGPSIPAPCSIVLQPLNSMAAAAETVAMRSV